MRLLRWARSLRLTIVLLCAAAAYVLIAAVSDLGFDTLPFIAILVLFGINLAACTAHRLVYHPHRRAVDYLPDLIHTALFIILLGAAASLVGRRESSVPLSVGDQFSLAGRYELTLTETRELPDNWVSRFTVFDRESGTAVDGDTRVNAPLVIDGFRLHQTRWAEVPVVELQYEDGRRYTMAEDEGFQIGDDLFVLDAVDDPARELPFDLVWFRDGAEQDRVPVRSGTRIGGLVVTGTTRIARTVITVVRDPGMPIALIGGVLLAGATTALAIARAREVKA